MSSRGQFEILETYDSMSSNAVYEVRRGGDGVMYCTCPAWRMKQGRASCKHLDEYLVMHSQVAKQAGPREQITTGNIRVGSVVECNSRGLVFLVKVTGFLPNSHLEGVQLLDSGEAPVSLRAERLVDVHDIVRVLRR
jgi:predicted nucleic acid-binding Zn finger protein